MLKIDLLGYPTIQVDAQSIDISRRKALGLLAYLVMTNRPHTRDHLCALLWTHDDTQTARAELRRMLSVLNQTALKDYIKADRHTIQFISDSATDVDVWSLNQLLNEGNWQTISEHVEHWSRTFLQGFHLDNATQFDSWQQLTNTQIHQRLTPVLEQLVMQAQADSRYADAIRLLSGWLMMEPENEILHRWLLRCYAENGQPNLAIEHYVRLQQRLAENDETVAEDTNDLIDRIRQGESISINEFAGGVLPPMPQMIVGREEALIALRNQLEPSHSSEQSTRIVIQGWPGIGKTTLTAALAHDPILQRQFKDGILWASLGQSPDMLSILQKWGNAMGVANMAAQKSVAEASEALSNALHNKQVLLIVDDVWDEAHFTAFNIGGRLSATLITTRLNRVAQALIRAKSELYKLPVLSDEQALALLATLTPDTVANHPNETKKLVHDLEGLPLALQVAGRLLREEHALGWGIEELLHELTEGTKLLVARAPQDRQQADDDVPTTIAALLELSTATLDEDTCLRFALLGVFAPKPAIFELGAMQAVWEVKDGRPTVRRLVERGLLEVVPGGAFQMHSLLVQHARSMFGDSNALPEG